MASPESPRHPARDLLASALCLRSALGRMDLESAARAGAECDQHVRALASSGANEPEPRRWARAAARMLSLCQRRVLSEQQRVARDLDALDQSELRAARYTGASRPVRRSA